VSVVFHDLCHLSFFREKWLNLCWAYLLSPITTQLPQHWMRVHNHHHHVFGDKNDETDWSLTVFHDVEQFLSWPLWKRFCYRTLRDPCVFFVLAGIYFTCFQWLFVLVSDRDCALLWPLAFYWLVRSLFGWQLLMQMIGAQVIYGSILFVLFHLQHGCNTPYRVDREVRTMMDTGLLGSTYMPIAWPLSVFTLGVEIHHVHHASTRVPCYRLMRCHAAGEALGLWRRAGINEVGLLRAMKSLFHVLYEVAPHRLPKGVPPRFVSFEPWRSLGLED